MLAVLVACLLLPARSFAWQIATPHVELGRQIFFDWARKEGRNAELADKRNNLGIQDGERNNLGIQDGEQNRNARKEYEEALKTYRQLAQKDPETYLRYVAAPLNELGILDSEQNRLAEARMEFEEALKIYRELAQKNPEAYLPQVATTLNNLGILDGAQDRMNESRKEHEQALKTYRKLAQKDPEAYLPYVAMSLDNLVLLDSAQNRMGEARKECEEALKTFPSWEDLSDGQWQEACRRNAVIRPLAEQDAVSRQAAAAAAEQLGIGRPSPSRGARKKEGIDAVGSEASRPGFLKTLYV